MDGTVRNKQNPFFAKDNHIRLAKNQISKSLVDTDMFIASVISTLNADAAQLIIHPLEYGSMFQDRAGTTPVTESGQLVGHVLDAGPGDFHATAVSDAARGIFRDVGGFRYIEYNGVNTAYQTPVLPAPGVDKSQVFAGVRKLAISGEIVENNYPNGSGRFFLRASNLSGLGNQYSAAARGTASPAASLAAESSSSYTPPITNVLTSLNDIAGNLTRLRINGGAEIVSADGNKGDGNFNPAGTERLNYGARVGTSLFFNGRHYATLGPIVRFGTNATAAQIEAAEAYYTARTDL